MYLDCHVNVSSSWFFVQINQTCIRQTIYILRLSFICLIFFINVCPYEQLTSTRATNTDMVRKHKCLIRIWFSRHVCVYDASCMWKSDMYSIIMTFEAKALHTSAKTARRLTKLIQVCFYLLFPPYVSVIPDMYMDCHTYYCLLYFHYGCVHGKPYRRLPCHLHVMTFRDNTRHICGLSFT